MSVSKQDCRTSAARGISDLAATLLATAAHADGSSVSTPEAFPLGVIVVSATRLPEAGLSADPVGAVVTWTEMRQFNRETVGSALNLLPGVTLSSNVRNEQLVYMRGFDPRQVPLFIDGTPVYVPYDGYVDFNRFGTYDVAAIQLAKGFTSIAYGPNTLGGAINVVSRKPTETLEGDLVLGLGGEDVRQAGLNAGTRQDRWYAQAGASLREADGFRLSSDFSPTATENGGQRNNADSRDTKWSLRVGITPRTSDEYALSYYRQDGDKGQPPSTDPAVARFWRWPQWDKESLYFNSRTALGPSETLVARLYRDEFDNEVRSYTDDTYTTLRTSGRGSVSTGISIHDDRTTGGALELQSNRLDRHALRLAVQQRQDRHEERDATDTVNSRYEDTLWSVGIEDMIALGERWQLALGVARQELEPDEIFSTSSAYSLPDDNDAIDYQAGLFFDEPATGQWHATIARKSRLPTMKDRYSQRLGNYVENPDLGAEQALNLEIGYHGAPRSWLSVEAAVFRSDVDDKIQSVFVAGGTSCSPVTPCQMQNVGEARHTGLELGLGITAGDRFEAGGNFTLLDQENRSDPDIRLTGVPDRKLFLYATAKATAWLELQASLEHNSDRWISNTAQLDGYTIGSMKATTHLPRDIIIEAGVDNVTDHDYELDMGFPAPGRSWFANLRHEF